MTNQKRVVSQVEVEAAKQFAEKPVLSCFEGAHLQVRRHKLFIFALPSEL